MFRFSLYYFFSLLLFFRPYCLFLLPDFSQDSVLFGSISSFLCPLSPGHMGLHAEQMARSLCFFNEQFLVSSLSCWVLISSLSKAVTALGPLFEGTALFINYALGLLNQMKSVYL